MSAEAQRAALIEDSLEIAAAAGDPSEAIYRRLFAAHPELEALFVMDTDGGVRGGMLAQAFTCLIDLAGDGQIARTVVAVERENHYSYGVPDAVFDGFLAIARDEVRARCGPAWTPAMDTAWSQVLEAARRLR